MICFNSNKVDNITSLSQTETSRFELRKYVEVIRLFSILVEQAIQLKKMHLAPKPLDYMVDMPLQFEPIDWMQYQNQYFYRGFWVDAYEVAKKFNLIYPSYMYSANSVSPQIGKVETLFLFIFSCLGLIFFCSSCN